MKSFLIVLPVSFIMFSCTPDNTSETTDLEIEDIFVDTLETAAPTEAIAFQRFSSQAPSVTLPFGFSEADLQNIDHSKYIGVADTAVENYFLDFDSKAKYFLVAKPFEEKEYTGLIILESKLDTSFNAKDRFYFYTYTSEGNIISDILFASATTDKKHYKMVGIMTPAGQIKTIKYEYFLKNGAWTKNRNPIKTVNYQIDSLGQINEIGSEINIDLDEQDEIKTI